MAIKPLWALAGHIVLNRGDLFDLKDPETLSALEEGTQVVWNRLKESGSFALKDLMKESEEGQYDFQDLARRFSFPEGAIPVDAAPYERALEDEALTKIFKKVQWILIPEDTDFPYDPDAIKKWLADPQNQFACGRIQWQSFDLCSLRALPPDLEKFSAVHTLDVSQNFLAAIPECLKRLPLLTDINFCNNRVRAIPVFLGELTQLKFLNLSKNLISSVPRELEKLTALECLSIFENRIFSFPDSLTRLTQLNSFDASYNHLTSVPSFLAGQMGLKFLTLGDNKISALPEFLRNFTKLKALLLGGNLISRMSSILSELTQLRSLDLARNEFDEIPEFIFSLRLKTLYLEGNRIRRIPDAWEKIAARLQYSTLFNVGLERTGGFDLSDNPLLCIFDSKQIVYRSPEELAAIGKAFNHYQPTSPLARFCQSLATSCEVDQEAFFALKVEDRTLIAEMRGMDLFDDFFGDITLFAHAVRKAIGVKYEHLSREKDNVLALIDAEQSPQEQGPQSV